MEEAQLPEHQIVNGAIRLIRWVNGAKILYAPDPSIARDVAAVETIKARS